MVFLILPKWPDTPPPGYLIHLDNPGYKLLCLRYYGFPDPAQMARYPASGVFGPFGQFGPCSDTRSIRPFVINFYVLDIMVFLILPKWPDTPPSGCLVHLDNSAHLL